ncbi:MAG: carboxypeptidase-like regulatory domain-containing protein, partial [Vicinamibacterales bacterium]
MKLSKFSVCAVWCLAVAASAGAQQSIEYGSISGRVIDPQGAAIPGASIAARQTATNVTAETAADSEGRFRLSYLRIGAYEIKVKVDGFRENTRTLTLSAGSAFDVPIALEVAGIDATVTVAAHAEMLETARSQIAGTVSQAEVQTLPMNGRNFLDLALLVPGVSPTNTNSTQLFAETSGVPGQGISISSQRNF